MTPERLERCGRGLHVDHALAFVRAAVSDRSPEDKVQNRTDDKTGCNDERVGTLNGCPEQQYFDEPNNADDDIEVILFHEYDLADTPAVICGYVCNLLHNTMVHPGIIAFS